MKALLFSLRLPVAVLSCLMKGRFIYQHAWPDAWPAAFTPEVLQAVLSSKNPDIILIGAVCHEDDDAQIEKLLGDQREQIRMMTAASDLSCLEMPHSFVLLRALHRHRPPGIPIVVFIDDPSVYVIEILLKLGADWVWPHLDSTGECDYQFAALTERLKALR